VGGFVKYFAYGSNMSISRLRARVPSANRLGCFALKQHDLRFHKSSKDGSAKCDAFYTGADDNSVFGALFEICSNEKSALDRIEGLGYGYDEKLVVVHAADGTSLQATTYFATAIDENLEPYSWYLHHVLKGAIETALPVEYIQSRISAIGTRQDANETRELVERAIHD
jgi:gamma-glutamylcyclotransferase